MGQNGVKWGEMEEFEGVICREGGRSISQP
jgi:hypothetical protein